MCFERNLMVAYRINTVFGDTEGEIFFFFRAHLLTTRHGWRPSQHRIIRVKSIWRNSFFLFSFSFFFLQVDIYRLNNLIYTTNQTNRTAFYCHRVRVFVRIRRSTYVSNTILRGGWHYREILKRSAKDAARITAVVRNPKVFGIRLIGEIIPLTLSAEGNILKKNNTYNAFICYWKKWLVRILIFFNMIP